MTPRDHSNPHAHVLGALLGKGDPDLTGEVEVRLLPSRVMFAGLDSWLPAEDEAIRELGLRHAGAAALAETSAPVLVWIGEQHIEHIAVRYDLDVLDPAVFRSLTFNRPGLPADACHHRAHAVGYARNAQHATAATADEQLSRA